MTTGDELLHAIVTRPDDTELRLVYADWLEEHGELDRATFIRTECALVDVPKYDPRWKQHLVWARRQRHSSPSPTLPAGVEWHPFEFERGFAARIRVRSVTAFLGHAPTLFAQTAIRELFVDARGEFDLHRLLSCELLSRVRRLEFSGGRFTHAEVTRVIESPQISRLTELGFTLNGIDEGGLRVLLRSPLARRLRALELGGNFDGTGAPFDTFRECPAMPALESLSVASNRMDARATTAIADNAQIPNLTTLELTYNPIGNPGLVAIAGSATLQQLQHLDIGNTRPRVTGVRALLASTRARQLRSFGIQQNGFGPNVARMLANTEWPQLEYLNAKDNRFGDEGITALASVAAPKLRRVELHGNSGDEARAREMEASLVERCPVT